MDESPRAAVRDRAVLRTLLAGGSLQVTIAVSTLVALPSLAGALTADEFGVFATLTGLAALLSFADLGVGGSLTTRLAEVRARDDVEGARRLVSTALVAGTVIGVVVAIALALSAWVAPWRSILGAESVASAEITRAVLAAALATGASVPAAIGQRVLYGIGRGATANLLLAVSAVLGTALLVIGSSLDWALFWLVFVGLTAPVTAGITGIYLAVTRYAPDLLPGREHVSVAEWRALRRVTGWHFAISVAGAVSFQTDLLIVSGVLGAAAAGIYGVAQRAFGLVVQTLTPALLQLWPAFGDAHFRGDREWLRSRLRVATLATGLTSAAAGVFLVAAGPLIVRAVLTDDLAPSRGLLVALAAWTTYSVISAPTFMLLNATGYVHLHARAAIAVAIVNLPVSIVLTQQIGIAGPAWGSLIASVVCSAPVGIHGLRALFRRPNEL